ncbi:MAG TPA: DUF1998 domain-containing protein [Chryseolinea sp.]|nr:DUF1998 domain-containing protein [Chryseolinea sp.]
MEHKTNNQANEAVGKFKLLSSYGGPGSLLHTEYGSIMVSCIEEWGFITRIVALREASIKLKEDEYSYVVRHAEIEGLLISDDLRLLQELQRRKRLPNLKYLALVPDIELSDVFHTIQGGKTPLAINSTFFPKIFFNDYNIYRPYREWHRDWVRSGMNVREFSPPRASVDVLLKQDNIVLICDHGHCSDFPWSRFLKWRIDNRDRRYGVVDIFACQTCCNDPQIQIVDTNANASGFDGKWLRCRNRGCQYGAGVSLKGLMGLKLSCPGHMPWETAVGDIRNYYGDAEGRRTATPSEVCHSQYMRVALTTGNNTYFSRTLSSLFMPNELFMERAELEIIRLETELELAMGRREFRRCEDINNQIEELRKQVVDVDDSDLSDAEREMQFRNMEFSALLSRNEEEININDDLRVVDVTQNLEDELRPYFSRVLRIDNLKVTSAQLDFTRVQPVEDDPTLAKDIFRSSKGNVMVYPVVQNFGEGIFIAFNEDLVSSHSPVLSRFSDMIDRTRSSFARSAVATARLHNWHLYLVHTFSHLLMRELEFRCGYPTSSLSERLYISSDPATRMFGVMIYTAEGAEGSMGGLIAQTRTGSLNSLIKSALMRATVCNSDPLCWNSQGQGLFELNLASCFSCSLISETSCEKRNMYLDRRIVVDESFGFFKNLV